MSSLDYSQRIGGKGQARGLPVRTGSHYYEKDPEDKYQNVVSLGTTNTDQHHLSRFVYRKLPHLPVTYTKTPYFNNPDAPNSGNLSRPRYMVIKRGQFLMVAEDDQPSIGLFVDGGTASVEDKTYMDPEDLATSGRIVGFTRGDGTRYKLDPEDGSTAGSDPDDVITQAEYDNLADTSDDTATDQDDYVAITADSPLSIDRFQALTDEEQEGFTAVYEGTTDDNDRIATGGTNLYAEVESAYFNETDKAVNVEVDVDGFYFGGGTSSHGFVFPSSGGADRTLFYNEVDKKARVTLPSNGADESRVVEPIGNVSDVSAANIAEYVNSAAYLEARPTSGFAHTDREQALSKHWHGFTTGTEAIQPAQKGRLRIPFVDISKLQTIVQNRTDLTWGDDFNFAATSDDRSGVKVGVYGETDLSIVNKASILTEEDAGYANLHRNFGAPFLVATRKPRTRDQVKPDLFGYATLADAGILSATGGTFGGNFSAATEADNVDGDVDMHSLGLEKHVVGSVLGTRDADLLAKSLADKAINKIFQTRLPSSGPQNVTNSPGQRLGYSADSGGASQLLADFGFLMLGGSAPSWASGMAPEFDGLGQDISNVLRELIIAQAVGVVEVAVDTVGA